MAYAGHDPVIRHRRWCRCGKPEAHRGNLATGPCWQVAGAQLVRTIGLAHRVVPSVGIIGEGLIADAEAAAQDEFVCEAIGQTEAGSKVMVVRVAAEVHGVTTNACED